MARSTLRPGLSFSGLGAITAIAALAAFPLVITSPYYIHLATLIAVYAILVLGLDIVVGYTGEVSLGHAGLFGIGAYTAGVLKFQLGLGLLAAVPAGIVVAALFGFVLALPALRVTGPYLAMVTLAFGTIVQILINEMDFLTNGPMGITIRQPRLVGVLPRASEFYEVVAILLVATIIALNRLMRSQFGRAFEALRDAPIACDCMGVSVYANKVYAFVISAGLAGLAGSLFCYSEQYISPNSYGFELTVQFLLALTLGGRKSRSGPLLGATIVVLLPNLLSDMALARDIAALIAGVALVVVARAWLRRTDNRRRILIPAALCLATFPASLALTSITDYRLTVFGLMILFVVYYLPDGLVGWLRTLAPRTGRPEMPPIAIERDAVSAFAPTGLPAALGEPLLLAERIRMQFGGLTALNQVDLTVARGSIHGLIGPNGSGKSTMMNVLTGIYQPGDGRVVLAGTTVTGLTPAAIARKGIARTFQNVQLFGEMSALENVLVALHHSFRGMVLDALLSTPRQRHDEAQARARALALLDFVGLADLAAEEARNLPYGKQRLLEIGRALGLSPSVLLLDEPAAGLTAPDITTLIAIITKIRDHGVTVILIEHHMDVVMTISDTVTVLDFGHKIAEGRPAQVQADPKVIEAYLGGTIAETAA